MQASRRARRCRREMLAHAVRHQKLCIFRPAVAALGEAHLFFAERLAVRGAGVLLVRRAVADMAVDDDQGRTVAGAAEFSIACASRCVSLTSPT